MIIYNPTSKRISLDRELSQFLGIPRELKFITLIEQLTSPSIYFIHCHLVDKEQNA